MSNDQTILRLQQLEARDVPASSVLGIANGYNVFVFGNYYGQNSDVQGAMAVGGNATMSGYSVGASLSNTKTDSLIVGGNLNFTNGQVANGSVEVGGSISTSSFGTPNGTVKSGQEINFSAAQTQLTGISASMASQTANGTVTNNYGSLTLTGYSSGTNVFNLTAAQLASCYGLTINVPQGSSVVINVSGQSVSLQNFGINVNGTDSSHITWNMYQATSVSISGISVPGSILAPYASVEFDNGQINGTLVAANFCGNGQFNWVAPVSTCTSISGTVYQTTCTTTTPDACVTVTLAGTDTAGTKITTSTKTDTTGYYEFDEVPAGTYSLSVSTPKTTHVSSQSGSLGGLAHGKQIEHIFLSSGAHGHGYLFDIKKW